MQKLVLDLGCGEGRGPEVSWSELEYDDHFRVGTDLNIEKLKKIKKMRSEIECHSTFCLTTLKSVY